ncbi:hypothetical protein EAE96_005520 [Botrytis aclada]|nr:hypothetical protein EAE96_005520 [Botrytis aclada]
MAAVPPPGDDDKWAPGFELPIPSAEAEDKKDEGDKENAEAVPTKKAETIRGTATVDQPGPNLAERPEKETTAEYFASWAEAEKMMRADLERKKFTPEQVEEVKKLMEAGAKKMKLPYKKAPGEMTVAQWEEKAAKLEAELKNKGKEGDKYVAQLMALQDQLRRSEVANLEMETRNAKLEKERKDAIAAIDKAAQEKRDQKSKEDKEKEDEKKRTEAEKHAKALRDKDGEIQALKQEVEALSKSAKVAQEKRDQKSKEDKAKEDEMRNAEAEKHAIALRDRDDKIRTFERRLDALAQRAETEKKAREEAAAEEKEKDKKAEILQKQALEKDEKIKKLEKDLEEEKHKNDLEEAGYHRGAELEATIKRLGHEKNQLKKEAVKLNDQLQEMKERVQHMEIEQVRFLEVAAREEEAENMRFEMEEQIASLNERIGQYEDEEKANFERESLLKRDRQTLAAQVVQKQTEISQLNEQLNKSKEELTECQATMETLRKAAENSSGALGKELSVLEEEIKKLERRVKEQDIKISQQESEIGAQKKTIEEQAMEIRIGAPGASHGELALQNQAIVEENKKLKKQLEDMQKNQGADNSEELKKQLEASQNEYAIVQKRVEKLLQEFEEVQKTKLGEGANASEIERLKQESKKAASVIHKLTQETQRAVGEIKRLTGELNKARSELERLSEEKEDDVEMIRHLTKENEEFQFEIGRLRSLRPPPPVIHPSQKELEYNKNRVSQYQEQEHEWGAQEHKLKAEIDSLNKSVEETTAITQQCEDLIDSMTLEQTDLHESLAKLKLELAAAKKGSADDDAVAGEAAADAAERERAHAEKIKELTERNSALSKQVKALKGEIEKIRKSHTGTTTDAEKEKQLLNQQQANASAQTVHMLMGFMILQRALNGKVSGDMDRVLAAVEQARLQAEAVGDEKLIVEVSYLAAIAVYYEGDTPKALASFNFIKYFKDWDDSKKDLVKQWIAHCEKGTDCPTGRSGYREALGLGPVPPSLRVSSKLQKDKDDEEAKKAKKEAKKAKKEAKKAKKAAKKAAKKSKIGTKPRKASAPQRRGIHRPDLYVGILSQRQQQIWDTIDFSDFDYNDLTHEQQSLFSFFPIDSEPESPRRPVVHKGTGPSKEYLPLPAPHPDFEFPPLPPSDSESSPEAPPPPPPRAPPGPPRKTKPRRPASSGASSAVSAKGAQGTQEEKPSRMSQPTTDAALHIQYLIAQLAESGRCIKELERTGETVETLTGRVERRDKQIRDLKLYCEQIVAENATLKGDA